MKHTSFWKHYYKLIPTLGVVFLYILSYLLLFPLVGASMAIIAVIPILGAGLIFGFPGGLLAGFLSFPLHITLNQIFGLMDLSDWIKSGGLIGSLSLMLIGSLFGRMKDLQQLAEDEIGERKRIEEQLLHTAYYDKLTNLPNRNLLMDRIERAFARAKRLENYLFAVLSLNLANFNSFNNSHGYEFGDLLLAAVAQRLLEDLRYGDT